MRGALNTGLYANRARSRPTRAAPIMPMRNAARMPIPKTEMQVSATNAPTM